MPRMCLRGYAHGSVPLQGASHPQTRTELCLRKCRHRTRDNCIAVSCRATEPLHILRSLKIWVFNFAKLFRLYWMYTNDSPKCMLKYVLEPLDPPSYTVQYILLKEPTLLIDSPNECRKTERWMTEHRMTERRKTQHQMTERRMTECRMTERQMTERRMTKCRKRPNVEWLNAEWTEHWKWN
jgi:hypothetical protein